MSSKLPDGLLFEGEFFLKHPDHGGWYLGVPLTISYLFQTIIDGNGWEWGKDEDKEHKGAALVAPLNILVWGDV